MQSSIKTSICELILHSFRRPLHLIGPTAICTSVNQSLDTKEGIHNRRIFSSHIHSSTLDESLRLSVSFPGTYFAFHAFFFIGLQNLVRIFILVQI